MIEEKQTRSSTVVDGFTRIIYRDAAAAKATDEKEKAALPAGSFKVPDTANAA